MKHVSFCSHSWHVRILDADSVSSRNQQTDANRARWDWSGIITKCVGWHIYETENNIYRNRWLWKYLYINVYVSVLLVVFDFSFFFLFFSVILSINLPFFFKMSRQVIFFSLLQICLPQYCLCHPTGLLWHWNFTQLPVSSCTSCSKNRIMLEPVSICKFSHTETRYVFNLCVISCRQTTQNV